ncbi:hypothetical protein APS55_03135 [Apilactobacillus kunkeei]|uniref:Uncharacterized protein n=1 Tax=Apilactobacillus kunkeei TaxID=148814 RepID=A0AAC8WBN7_9LACO|nr:hypothetical protein [Apilactobacillus kunkeei]ALJ31285.1 hypothetical protein APS55_03135 [Apilactobacillus kunkeei]KFJ14732.1 hypothetical protein JI66_06200 [Apilactobacillus kunkeei]
MSYKTMYLLLFNYVLFYILLKFIPAEATLGMGVSSTFISLYAEKNNENLIISKDRFLGIGLPTVFLILAGCICILFIKNQDFEIILYISYKFVYMVISNTNPATMTLIELWLMLFKHSQLIIHFFHHLSSLMYIACTAICFGFPHATINATITHLIRKYTK